jgi:hypothetical protein
MYEGGLLPMSHRVAAFLWIFLLVISSAALATQNHVRVAEVEPEGSLCSGEIRIPVSIEVDTILPTTRPGGWMEVFGTVTPERDAEMLVLRFESAGGVNVMGSEPVTLGSVRAGLPMHFSVLARVGYGARGVVHVWADLQFQGDDRVWSSRKSLYALTHHDRVYTGTGGLQSLQIAAIEDDVRTGLIAPLVGEERLASLAIAQAKTDRDPSRIVRRRMTEFGVVESSAIETMAVGSDEILVQGNVQWTDQNGNTHPVYRALVRIMDEDTFGDETVAELYTDADGNYSVLIDTNDGIGAGDRDVYVQVRAENEFIKTMTQGGATYIMQSGVSDETPGGSTLTRNFTAGNSGGGESFSVFQAAAWIGRYTEIRNGGALPKINLRWPNGGDGSFYDGQLQIEQDDRWDWDTIHHEYGHYVMDELNIEDNPGGPHNIGDCAAVVRGSKSEGNKLAWGEGWPTFFGTAGQQVMGLAALNVPRVGDAQYDDLEDTNVSYSLEAQSSIGFGEDNEVAVQRLLWDLFDSNNDGRDLISRSDQSIWNAIDAADPEILSTAWAALRSGQSVATQLLMGEIATDHRIGPRLTTPADGGIVSPSNLNFSWNADVGCDPSFDGDGFTLRFYNAAGTAEILSIGGLASTSTSLSLAQLDTLIASGHQVRWAVEGTNSSSPATGPYLGENNAITVNRPPVADAGEDVSAECSSHGTTPVALSGLGSSDPDGDTLTYSWSASPGVNWDDNNSPTPTGQFSKGVTTVLLTVSDGIQQSTDTVTVTVVDTTPPVISCPANIEVECTGGLGIQANDPQLAPFFAGVSATDTCDASPTIVNNAPAFFPLGTTEVTFTATDADGNSSSCSAFVTVVDTTPPEITLALDTTSIWPPNHKMVTINATVVVTDECDPNPFFVLTSIASNEPDNGLGDGDMPNDIQGAAFGTADLSFQVRAERAGLGSGRTYTVTYTAYDSSGNSAEASAVITVPKNK